MAVATSFDELMASVQRSAVHLEMRDGYTRSSEAFIAWQGGYRGAPANAPSQEWRELVRATTARGVEIKRARIVSEPLSDFVQFEYDITAEHNVAAGEQVRWLPRRNASDLMLPGNDLWIFDDQVVQFLHFAGDGTYLDSTYDDDARLVKLCSDSFAAVWERATPHENYRPAD